MKVYPYRRLTGNVSWRVDKAQLKVEGEPWEDVESKYVSTVERVVALGPDEDRPDWTQARLHLSAVLPAKAMDPTGPWQDVEVVAVLTERATNTRTAVELSPVSDDGRTRTAELHVHRCDLLDRASLALHVVATVDGVAGRVIATADAEWFVDVIEATPSLARELDVKMVGFASGAGRLQRFKEAPWVVDTTGRIPVVRVNTDFDGLGDLIGADGGNGAEKTVREVLLAQMCSEVWTAVFHSAVGDLEIEDDGTPLFPHGWQGDVLREMLPDMYPDREPEDALREVHAARTGASATGWGELQSRIHFAASRRAGVPRALSTTIRDLERLTQGDDA
ncbi:MULTISPECIES: hypothetical protein [Streptomyces]|uniref:Uncharacterized protein n=2 Tax=Streptomyces TaxID=1883 RepID=A0A117IUB1_9ACTN|nr:MULTISPECIES: hypothetical protein [Streptomyces]KUH35270.1 hypothetical protein ATE80_30225 [Streptomyces kanasensis]UUS34038.1 hypothetical protein NRO40_26555 [Streptomyces changanensis]